MSERIGNVTFIYEEKSQVCDECNQIKELRPYGKNGAKICYDCAIKNPIEATINMHKFLFNENVTEEKAKEYLKLNPFK